jgi:hypothetical protein
MSANDATPYDPSPTATVLLRGALDIGRSTTTYRMQADVPGFALLKGDLVILDLNATPEDGTLVLANRVDAQTGSATTVVRRKIGHKLASGSPHEAVDDLRDNNPSIAILGTIIGTLRGDFL